MRCNDCGFIDRHELHDKCPKCKSDDWADWKKPTPQALAKTLVREWFDASTLWQISFDDEALLIRKIAAAIKAER
jgi:hypothetical protein